MRCSHSTHTKFAKHTPAKERDLGLEGVLLELIDGAGTKRVGADERSLPALALVVVGEFCAARGLAATLQTDKHDDVRLALFRNVRLALRIEHRAQLLDDGLGSDIKTRARNGGR